MFNNIITIADELSRKVGTIKSQRENRRIRIANFFNKLGTCLEKIIVAVEENQPFDNRIEELKTYVDSFSFAVGDIIGFELTERLLELLRTELDEENFRAELVWEYSHPQEYLGVALLYQFLLR